MKGGCLWILWNGDPFIVTLFYLNPDRIKGGCERFAFSRMRGYGTKMTNIWRKLKRAQNTN